ncbi:MAG: bifunctional UDP-N-acetylglucosamine diphosphorylase/glucosamine-1-phosphate N-acetyltransferase GlmU [Betaproteobacteria bacterium]|nr:bifunctional UDP-N-acetylglucosamine diphosphorylase/glucosamine-1-phosphate N-acetyltransferase GlmU [Betaproteobacteria bacterium]
MQTELNIVILAAGKGTRMHSNLPKVLHPLAGKPLLFHVIDTASQLDPTRLLVVYGHGGDALSKAVAQRGSAVPHGSKKIIWVEQAQQLGTGHALQQTLAELGENGLTLILFGDVPLISAETLRTLLNIKPDEVGMLTVTLPDPTGYGRIVRDMQGKVTAIVEHKDASEAQRTITEVNTGIMALPTRELKRWLATLRNDNAQGEYYLTDVIALAVKEGKAVSTCQPRRCSEVLGINGAAQLAELERLHQLEIAASLMGQGVRLIDPARIDVRGELSCGRDVAIDANCIFEGKVILGDNVTVGANCILRDVNVAAGTLIAPFSLLEQAQIGADSRIGPFARIRPGTVLAAEVHIGNFVELKNSQVDRGSKINHLSYVGDTTVGKNVNIGAGTITCNYDGANKHRTVIEDDVFIGSDTQLVAPVTVGRGATIGAGATITKDAPADQLTLSRAKQISVSGWKRPEKKAKEK